MFPEPSCPEGPGRPESPGRVRGRESSLLKLLAAAAGSISSTTRLKASGLLPSAEGGKLKSRAGDGKLKRLLLPALERFARMKLGAHCPASHMQINRHL